MSAMTYAFLCMISTSLNDVLFKMFTRKPASHGGFVAVIGVISLLTTLLQGENLTLDGTTIFWGSLVGLCSIVGNILLIDSMSCIAVGISSTIYRLNMIPVILVGWLFFGETISAMHWCAVAAACLAVCFFLPRSTTSVEKKKRKIRGISLALAAMLLRAGLGIFTKMSEMRGVSHDVILLGMAVMWILGGILWYLFRERREELPFCSRHVLLYGSVSGITVFLILFFTLKMLAIGEMSVTLPLAQMSFVLTFFVGVLLLGEKFSRRRVAGALLGVVAVVLLGMSAAG